MNASNTELADMVEQANAIVTDVALPVGFPDGWRLQQHLFSMIAAISAIFAIFNDLF